MRGSLICLSLCGCQDSRVTNLEQRVNQLESKTRELESERNKSADEDATRRTKLEACVEEANADFQRNLVINGSNEGWTKWGGCSPLLEPPTTFADCET